MEAGLADGIEKIWIEPWDDAPELLAVNPLGKIPALLTPAGEPLIESACICDFLIAQARRPDLLPMPQDISAREEVLRRVALGRAAMDCAFGAVIQRRFNGGKDTELSQRWRRGLPAAPDLGDLAVAVAFDYIRFRLAEVPCLDGTPALARLLEAMNRRPSLQSTRPD